MNLRFFFISVLLISMGFAKVTLAVEPPVRILIQSELTELKLSGFDLQIRGVTDPEQLVLGRTHLLIRRIGSVKNIRWELTLQNGKTAWVKEVSQKQLEIRGHLLARGPVEFPDTLLIKPAGASPTQFQMVGLIPMKEYLVGVLSSEVPLSWPVEALKAQAIAARSYTLATMKDRKAFDYDLQSNINDQVFKHITSYESKTDRIKKARRVVEETAEVYLISPKGKVVRAYYHSDCGGETIEANQVWPGAESFGVAKDPSCHTRKENEWRLSANRERVFQKIASVENLNSLLVSNTIDSLRLISGEKSERVAGVSVIAANGQSSLLPVNDFRRIIGFAALKSARFKMEPDKNSQELIFKGKGAGHGVGLCQFGARSWAEQGLKAQAILTHYYPKAHLNQLN